MWGLQTLDKEEARQMLQEWLFKYKLFEMRQLPIFSSAAQIHKKEW